MTNKTDLNTRLERKKSAEQKLKYLITDASNTSVQLGAARHQLIEARQRVSSYSQSVERHKDHPNRHSQYSEQLAEADKEYQDLCEKVSTFEKRMLSIQDEREHLKKVIADCDTGASADELKKHQKDLDKARFEIVRLKTLIAEQEKILVDASHEDDEELEGLQSRREDILASIVLGKAKQSDLDELDNKITNILEDAGGKQHESLEQYRQAFQTTNGLYRRLQEAEAHRDELENLSQGVVEQFLISQAEMIIADYGDHAKLLAEQFARLKAIDELLIAKTDQKSMRFISGDWYRMYIPSLIASDAEQAVFDAKAFNYPALMQAETDRFREMGFQEFF